MNVQEWYGSGDFSTIDNLKVFYKREGDGETLMLIHGFPSSSWDFEKIWSVLSKKFDCIASDLIGLGKSAKPQMNITVKLQADIIENLLEEKGVKNAHILAHDLGDTVAQELLARQYEGSSKINWLSCIFLNGGIFPETHRPLFIQKLLISPLGSVAVKLLSKSSLDKNMKRAFGRKNPPSKEFIDTNWDLIVENNGKLMIPRLIRYMKERETFRERWVNPLSHSMIPIRLINGVKDPISGKHAADRFAELIPNADIKLLTDSGHYPHVEEPEKVLDGIFEFYKKLNSHE